MLYVIFISVQPFSDLSTVTLPPEGTSGPGRWQQNVPHLTAEPLDPFAGRVKHRGLYHSLGMRHTRTHPLVKNMVKDDWSHLSLLHISACGFWTTELWVRSFCAATPLTRLPVTPDRSGWNTVASDWISSVREYSEERCFSDLLQHHQVMLCPTHIQSIVVCCSNYRQLSDSAFIHTLALFRALHATMYNQIVATSSLTSWLDYFLTHLYIIKHIL